jgi:hypothetical protein
MEEAFDVSFSYKGVEQRVQCALRVSRFTYQFLCRLGEAELVLEKDDEGNLRAINADRYSHQNKNSDSGLVKALIEEMERILH